MNLTVGEVLELPPLRELTLVAGREGIDRPVTRVSVLEVPLGYRRWSRGGELFMSSLYALRDQGEEAYANTIRLIAEGQAAALCLHPGVTGYRFLETMIAESDRCGVPLILLPDDMPYCVVTDAVVGGLLGQQSALLERSAAVNRELTQNILSGSGLDGICRTVARRMHRSVAVLGAGNNDVLAQSERLTPAERSLLGRLEPRVAANAVAAKRIPPSPATGKARHVFTDTVDTPQGPVDLLAAPIVVDDITAAYLVIWGSDDAYSELDLMIVAHACTAVGLEVLKQRAVIEAEHRVQQDFYGAALSEEYRTVEDVSRHARHAGITVAPRYLVSVVDRLKHDDVRRLRMNCSWPDAAVVALSDLVAIILPIYTRGSRHDANHVTEGTRLVQHIVEQCTSLQAPATPTGVSRMVESILALPTALTQAKLALSVAKALGRTDHPVLFDDLGVLQLLANVNASGTLTTFVADTLKPLLNARDSTLLIQTTEAYLDAGGGYLAAAKSLNVHPNTVKYRIEKIRDMLGFDLFDDPARRLGLHVALKGFALVAGADCASSQIRGAELGAATANLSSEDNDVDSSLSASTIASRWSRP